MKLSRRHFVHASAALLAAGCTPPGTPAGAAVPVILDTDIGDDIDDTWALLMLLREPQLDLRLAVGDFGKPAYRARLLARLLALTGRSDVPVGIGIGGGDTDGLQSGWLGDYRLDDYPGTVREDGVQAIIDTIMASAEPVTLLCIGPVPNIAEALRREPAIAGNARFVGMQGAIRVGYGGDPVPAAEWNVRVDPASLQSVFAAPWSCTIAPLDTGGVVVLDGEDYARLRRSDDPWVEALLDNYAAWLPGAPYVDPDTDVDSTSTTLYDTVAVYLAIDESLVDMETLPLRVTDDGYTVIDTAGGRPVRCAVGWKDLAAFRRRLVDTLLG